MRRLLRVVCLCLALFSTEARAAAGIGAYVWGGQITLHPGIQGFYDTVNLALTSGFDTIRFKIGPNQASDYKLTSDPCASTKSLACYAQLMFASSAWDNPGLKTVMVTAVDFTCNQAGGGNNKACYTPSTLSANKVAIEAEYTALFQAFQNRFAGRGIRLVLSNWEGDNFVYCGDSYDYGKGGSVTTSCNTSLSTNGQTGVQAVQGFLQWVSYKDEAVANFIAANPTANIVSAPEFNNYQQFVPGCGGSCNAAVMSSDSIIGQIKAAGGRQYCSYSSYDSQGGPGGTYIAAIRDILTVCQNLIIGEAGYGLGSKYGPVDQYRLFLALGEIAQVSGVLSIVPWNAVNPADGSQAYGMWDVNGRQQVLPLLGPLRPTPQVAVPWR